MALFQKFIHKGVHFNYFLGEDHFVLGNLFKAINNSYELLSGGL